MAEVYAMVTKTEIINIRENVIEHVLEVPFTIDETVHSFSYDNLSARWRVVNTHDKIFVDNFALSHFSSADFTTQTGEAIIIEINGEEPFLWIDIGSGEGIGGRDARFRQYSAFPLFVPLEYYFFGG